MRLGFLSSCVDILIQEQKKKIKQSCKQMIKQAAAAMEGEVYAAILLECL